MTHAPAVLGCSRAGVQMQGFQPIVCGMPRTSEYPNALPPSPWSPDRHVAGTFTAHPHPSGRLR